MTKNKVIKNPLTKTFSEIENDRNAIKEKFSGDNGYVKKLKSIDSNIDAIRIDLRKNLFPHIQSLSLFEEKTSSDVKEEQKPIFNMGRLTSYVYDMSGEDKKDHTGISKTQFGRVVESVVKECLILHKCNDKNSEHYERITVYSDEGAKKTSDGRILSRYCSNPVWNKKAKKFEFNNDRISVLNNDCLVIKHKDVKEYWNKINPETKTQDVIFNSQDALIKCSMELIATNYSLMFKETKEIEQDNELDALKIIKEITELLETKILSNENNLALMNTDTKCVNAWKTLRLKVQVIDDEMKSLLLKDAITEVDYNPNQKKVINQN